jgi:hypothetical protein
LIAGELVVDRGVHAIGGCQIAGQRKRFERSSST